MKESVILPMLRSMSSEGYSKTISKCIFNVGSKNKTSVFTPNSEMIYRALRDEELKKLLLSADILFPDGSGVYMASKAMGVTTIERTSGIDLAEEIMKKAVKHGYKIFLLGAAPGDGRAHV